MEKPKSEHTNRFSKSGTVSKDKRCETNSFEVSRLKQLEFQFDFHYDNGTRGST